jgi:hypothetical protein
MTPAEENNILEYFATNQKLAAVKFVKDYTGLGLKEAKDLVDSYWGSSCRLLIEKIAGSEKVRSVEHLYQLAEEKKAVKIDNNVKSKPAAFVINYSGYILVKWIKAGNITIYQKKKK